MSILNYSRFLTSISSNRVESPLRNVPRLHATSPPGTIFMGGGMPNESTYPFSRMVVELKDGSNLTLEGKHLSAALQYQSSSGYAPLIERLKELQTRTHHLSPEFWDTRALVVTSGCQEGICKAFEMCLNPGDPVVYQEPAYAGVVEIVRPYKPRYIPAVEDEFGVCPRQLRKVLEAEGTPEYVRTQTSGVPKLLYINPTGTNPSGITISTERKRQIYQLACEYDLLILEDDPYYQIHFDEKDPVSFLSLDTEGRVLRFDSFSKVLSAGIRVGYVTGPRPLIERIEFHMQVSSIHASALPQVIVERLLAQWGDKGFGSHVTHVRAFYKKQRDAMLAAAEKHLTGLAEWRVPRGGLFLWLRVPGLLDVGSVAGENALKHGVLIMPGYHFMLDDSRPSQYIRASFSTASEYDMNLGLFRLANLIREEIELQNKLIK